jgi:hypothetical protein
VVTGLPHQSALVVAGDPVGDAAMPFVLRCQERLDLRTDSPSSQPGQRFECVALDGFVVELSDRDGGRVGVPAFPEPVDDHLPLHAERTVGGDGGELLESLDAVPLADLIESFFFVGSMPARASALAPSSLFRRAWSARVRGGGFLSCLSSTGWNLVVMTVVTVSTPR